VDCTHKRTRHSRSYTIRHTEYVHIHDRSIYIHIAYACGGPPSGGALSHLGSRRLGSGRAGWALLRNCQKDLIDSQSGRVSSCLVRHGGRAQGAPRRRFQASTPARRPPPLCPPSPQIGQHSPIPLPSFFSRALSHSVSLSLWLCVCLSLCRFVQLGLGLS
jgi:hypothetical protein